MVGTLFSPQSGLETGKTPLNYRQALFIRACVKNKLVVKEIEQLATFDLTTYQREKVLVLLDKISRRKVRNVLEVTNFVVYSILCLKYLCQYGRDKNKWREEVEKLLSISPQPDTDRGSYYVKWDQFDQSDALDLSVFSLNPKQRFSARARSHKIRKAIEIINDILKKSQYGVLENVTDTDFVENFTSEFYPWYTNRLNNYDNGKELFKPYIR